MKYKNEESNRFRKTSRGRPKGRYPRGIGESFHASILASLTNGNKKLKKAPETYSLCNMDTESGGDSYDESVKGRSGRKLRTQAVKLKDREAVENLGMDVSKLKNVKQRKERVMSRWQATRFQVERLDLLAFRANGGVENP